jgi:hypothetical protein
MTQSKQEVAARNARIRAEKLRENLARRKQQTRQRASDKDANHESNLEKIEIEAGKNSLG